MHTLRHWFAAHRKLIVSITGVALIPLLYAGSLIWANHDPIGRLNTVPAMVVDLDSAAKTSTGDSIHLGPGIADSLTSSDQGNNLNWQEASEQEAESALADGDALAVLTIPEDFSATAASAGDDDPMKATAGRLQVRTNDASNYLMSTISSSVGTKVADSVRSQVSDAYLKNVYVGFTDLHGQLSDAADGAAKLDDGATDAHDGAGELVVGLDTLHDGTVKVDAGAVQLASGASDLTSGAGDLSSGLDTLQRKTASLPSQAKRLDEGATALAQGTDQVDSGARQLASGTASLSKGADTLASGTAALPSATQKLDSGAQQVADGNRRLATTASELDASVNKVSTSAQEALSSLGTLLDDTSGISSSSRVDVAGTAARGQQDLEALLADPQVSAAIKQAGLSDRAARAKSDLASVADGAADTQAAIRKAERSAGVVRSQQGTSVDDLIAGAKQISTAADEFASSTDRLADGAEQVADGTHQLAAKAPALASGASSLADGAQKLDTGAAKLAKNTPALASGASSLADGTGQLAAAAPTLAQAVSSASDGADQLADGAKQLSSGASSLAEGTGQLVSGSSDADSGASSLASGLGSLASGASDLDSGLSDGVSQVPSYTAAERDHLADVNATPVSLDAEHENAMANYGTGLAPYFISLALWIGGIGFFMLLSPLTARLLDRFWPAPLVALRAYVPAAIMAVVQASLVTAVALFALHLDVAHPWGLWGLALLASLTFLAVNHGLIALLGAPGRFLSLILVVLQVASSGGTYPYQTMPGIFRFIRDGLPMTYTVQAFRSLIAGGQGIGIWQAVVVLLIWLVVGLGMLTLGVVLARRSATVRDWATLAPGRPNGGRPVDEVAPATVPLRTAAP